MAQVFQCDACKKSGVAKAGPVTLGTKQYDCCEGCFARVESVMNPKPRGPKPDA